MSIRILLADDHKIMMDGLRLILRQATDMEVVGEASNGRAAVDLAGRLAPDVVVMDIGMPDLNGVEATRQIKAGRESVKVIALSAFADQRYVLGMLEAGASGYVVKITASDELVRAIRAVCNGERYLSPKIAGTVIDQCLGQLPQPDGEAMLSAREREVLQLVAEGKSSKQIAAVLHVSTKTVETHRRNIMDRLGLHSVAELTRYAITAGISPLDP